jgi:hypothetical protein
MLRRCILLEGVVDVFLLLRFVLERVGYPVRDEAGNAPFP